MVQAIKRWIGKGKIKKESSHQIEEVKIQAREKILFLLKGKKYSISAKCKGCGVIVSGPEIIKSFSKKTFITYIICKTCGYQVNPVVNVDGVDHKFLSPHVVLISLHSHALKDMSPENIEYWNSSVYHSAIFHFGTLKNVFNRIGKEYRYNEIIDWEEKIKPLFGLVPLSVISRIIGVPENKLRKIHKIK